MITTQTSTPTHRVPAMAVAALDQNETIRSWADVGLLTEDDFSLLATEGVDMKPGSFFTVPASALQRCIDMNAEEVGPIIEKIYMLDENTADSSTFIATGTEEAIALLDKLLPDEDVRLARAAVSKDLDLVGESYRSEIEKLEGRVSDLMEAVDKGGNALELAGRHYADLVKASTTTITALEKKVENIRGDKAIVREDCLSADSHARELEAELDELKARRFWARLFNRAA